MELSTIEYFSLLLKTMKKIFVLVLLSLSSSMIFSQDMLNTRAKRLSDLDIIFSILDKSNRFIISESQISTLLDSLSDLQETRSSELACSDKNNAIDPVRLKIGGIGYSIGDKTLGGIVFWVDEKGQHGLVAAETDQSEGETWYEGKTFSLRDGIFAGKYNTDQILTNKSVTFNAAQVCSNYKGGGFNDWYLPSKAELNLLYKLRNLISGFAKDYYWSSTEEENDTAWLLSFYGGYSSNYLKYGSTLFRVRAIRAF